MPISETDFQNTEKSVREKNVTWIRSNSKAQRKQLELPFFFKKLQRFNCTIISNAGEDGGAANWTEVCIREGSDGRE